MEQQHRTMIAAIQRGRFDGPNGGIQVPEGMSGTSGPRRRCHSRRVGRDREGRLDGPAGNGRARSAVDRSLDQMILDYLALGRRCRRRSRSACRSGAGLHRRALGADPAQGGLGLAVARRVGGAQRPGAHPVDVGARLDRVPGQDGRGRAPARSRSWCPRSPTARRPAVIRVTSPDASGRGAVRDQDGNERRAVRITVTVNGEQPGSVPAGGSVADLLRAPRASRAPASPSSATGTSCPKAEYAGDGAGGRATCSRWSDA